MSEEFKILYNNDLITVCESAEKASKALESLLEVFSRANEKEFSIEKVSISKEEELKRFINSYQRWETNEKRKIWKNNLLTRIKQEYEINSCPRCGETTELDILIGLEPDGVCIHLKIFCPECRKIEVCEQVNDYYGYGSYVKDVIDKFNNLKT